MSVAQKHTLCLRIQRRGLPCDHAAEVGVHAPESSNIYSYIQGGVRATLVEPEPDARDAIKAHFADCNNVTLHEYAMCDFEGEIELYKKGPSTFVGRLPGSPAIANDGYVPDEKDKFTVKAQTFDVIDDGTIDVLSADTEGSEWFVIKHMVSRPTVISIETHGGAYLNPYLAEIKCWMNVQGYRVWYKDSTDTVYVRADTFRPRPGDTLRLWAADCRIRVRRARKRLFKRR